VFIQEPFDTTKFGHLLTEWIIACDQPFNEVEKPEFINMVQYAHHSKTKLNLPDRQGIQRRVMNMGESTIEGTQDMFKVRSTRFVGLLI
jgi:hypothetical protein